MPLSFRRRSVLAGGLLSGLLLLIGLCPWARPRLSESTFLIERARQAVAHLDSSDLQQLEDRRGILTLRSEKSRKRNLRSDFTIPSDLEAKVLSNREIEVLNEPPLPWGRSDTEPFRQPADGFLFVEHVPEKRRVAALAFLLEFDGFAWRLVAVASQPKASLGFGPYDGTLSGTVRLNGGPDRLQLQYDLGEHLRGTLEFATNFVDRQTREASPPRLNTWADLRAVLEELRKRHGLRPWVVPFESQAARSPGPVYVTESHRWSLRPPSWNGLRSTLRVVPHFDERSSPILDRERIVPITFEPEAPERYWRRATRPDRDRMIIGCRWGDALLPESASIWLRRVDDQWRFELVSWSRVDDQLMFTRYDVGKAATFIVEEGGNLRVDLRLEELDRPEHWVELGFEISIGDLERQPLESRASRDASGVNAAYEELIEARSSNR